MALRLIGRKFIGFEKALERQAQVFAEIGGTEVELHFLEAEELYQRMVAGDGCTSGEYDLFLTVTDWYPTLIAGSAVRGSMVSGEVASAACSGGVWAVPGPCAGHDASRGVSEASMPLGAK